MTARYVLDFEFVTFSKIMGYLQTHLNFFVELSDFLIIFLLHLDYFFLLSYFLAECRNFLLQFLKSFPPLLRYPIKYSEV